MKNDRQTISMPTQHDSNNIYTILFGGFLALCNHLFGWMNTLLDIHVSSFLVTCLQAIITGSFGAAGAYFTNKLLKRFDKKKRNQ